MAREGLLRTYILWEALCWGKAWTPLGFTPWGSLKTGLEKLCSFAQISGSA